MTGYHATEAIRKLERPDGKTIPIIAMTADAFAEDVQKCLDAGMNAHVAKPIDVRDVCSLSSARSIRQPVRSGWDSFLSGIVSPSEDIKGLSP